MIISFYLRNGGFLPEPSVQMNVIPCKSDWKIGIVIGCPRSKIIVITTYSMLPS
jgi:hypothetical protein